MAKNILQEVATLNAELFNKIDIQKEVEDLKILNKLQLKTSNEILSYNISQNNINLAKYLQSTDDKVIYEKLQTDELKIKVEAIEDVLINKISDIEYIFRKERRVFLRNDLKRQEDIIKLSNNNLEYFNGPIMLPKLDANGNFISWDTDTLLPESDRNWIYIDGKNIKYKGLNLIKAGLDNQSNRITIGDSTHNEVYLPKALIVEEDIDLNTGMLKIITDIDNSTKRNSIETNKNIKTDDKFICGNGLDIQEGDININNIGSLNLNQGDVNLNNGDINLSENGDINLAEGDITIDKGDMVLNEGNLLLNDADAKIEIKEGDNTLLTIEDGIMTIKNKINIPTAFTADINILQTSGLLSVLSTDESIINGSLKLAKALTITQGDIDLKDGGLDCTKAINSTGTNITSIIAGNFEVGQKTTLKDTDMNGDLDLNGELNVADKFICTGSGSEFTNGLKVSGVLDAVANRAKYADVAEMYLSDKYYEKGTVLSHCSEDYECMMFNEINPIIGVVSSNPAYLLNSDAGKNSNDIYIPIVLKGRIPVKTKSVIRKGKHIIGDVDNPGYCKEGPSNSPYYIGVSLSQNINNMVEVKV